MADLNKEPVTENTAPDNESPIEPKAPAADTTPQTPDTEAPKKTSEDASADALESFLSREQEEKKPVKAPGRKKPLLIIIAAVAAVAILAAVLIILRLNPKTIDEEDYNPAELTASVNDDGVHEVGVDVDENGNITHNGSGSLMSYVPADIKQIDIENQDGSFTVISETPDGEETTYTLVGFEDHELQEGIADEIASHSAALEFSRVIAADGNPADYGLDHPRATVKVQYKDDTSAVIRVGNDAAGEDVGTYVGFGTTNAVFLVGSDDIKDFLYSINSLISLDITDTNEDSDNADFSVLTVSGTHFDQPITLEPNTDDTFESQYIVTSPVKMFANAVEASDIAGNVRGLYGEAVVCVNPSADQLASYGLSEPYAAVHATYPDTEITLSASAPNEEGLVYIYNPDKDVIYTIQLAAVCWAKTSLDLLQPENPLNVRLKYVSGVSFTAGDTDFTLDVSTATETTTDDDGNEQENSTTTAAYNGKELDTDNFNVFFQNLTAIKNQGKAEGSGKDKVMSVTLSYTSDRSDDTLTVYNSDSGKYIMEFNGDPAGTVSKAYIDGLIKGAEALIKGEAVEGL